MTPSPTYAVSAITYTIPSASTQGVEYTVTLDAAGYHCSCKAAQFRRACWHVKAIKAHQYTGKPRARLAVQPATNVPPVTFTPPHDNPAAHLWEA